jgi:hypothetical protein
MALAGRRPGPSADILFDQKVQGGTVEEQNIARQVLLVGAGQNNAGIVTINQDAGNMTNQANIIAIAFGAQAGEVLLADVWGTQELTGNSATVRDSGPRETRIETARPPPASWPSTSGGNFNQQVNALAVAVGFSVGPEFVAPSAISTLGAGTEADNALVEEGTQGPRISGGRFVRRLPRHRPGQPIDRRPQPGRQRHGGLRRGIGTAMTGRRTALAALLVVGAWAAPATAAELVALPGRTVITAPVKSMMELRFVNVVRQAYDVSCGAAALATLLTYYYDLPVGEQQII